MASFADLSANLKLNISDFSRKLNDASKHAQRFARNFNGQTNDASAAMRDLNKNTTAWGFNMKSISRVVSGIMISQAFYGMVQDIRAATNAVWEFTKQLEYAEIAYSNLFGDAGLAVEFINVLKDFAAKTPFTFTEAEASAKRLLAYGIEYSNVMYVMQGIMAAASAQGDPAKIEQISRAIGQIYTYGKLMTAEVRQLTEAGIPVYEILQEKLGLTQKQLKNLGNEAIPASVAINALIDGINERFGNVVEASSLTITGIISNIKDNATMLFAGIFNPLTVWIKSALRALGLLLFSLRDIMELRGIGGVFEAIFPKAMHDELRLLAANILALSLAFMRLVMAAGSLLSPVLQALIRVFNAFAPIIATAANVLAALVQLIASNATAMRYLTAALAAAAAMWVIFKVRALASAVVTGVITLISKALAGLSAMLTFVAAHPFWAMLIGLAGILIGISGGFGKISQSISDLFKRLTAFNGVNADKLLLPDLKDRNNDIDKFNNKLDVTNDNLDEAGDAAEGAGDKAKKAAKGLLSFDEVFKLPEPTDTASGAGAGGFEIPDFGELGDLGAGLGGALIPEIPDFGNFMDLLTNGFVDSLKEAWSKLKEKLIGAGIGALIGGALGGLLGGPLGAKIGAIAGAIAGWFWNDLAEKLGLTDIGKIAMPISTGIGAALGFLVGGPVGMAVGAGIGLLVGWVIDAIALGVEKGDWSRLAYPLSIGLGAGIGFLVGGPVGAGIGAAIGLLVGWIADKFIEADWSKVSEAFTKPFKEWADKYSDIFNLIWEPIKKAFEEGDWLSLGLHIITGIIEGALAALAAVTECVIAIFDAFWEAFKEIFGINSPAEETKPIGRYILEGVLQGILDTITEIPTYISEVGTAIISTMQSWFENIGTSVSEWLTAGVDSVKKFVDDSSEKIGQWVTDTITSFIEWKDSTSEKVTTWVTDTKTSFSDWKTDTYDKVSTWSSNVKTAFTDWKADTYSKVSGWVADTKSSFDSWKSDTYSKVTTWASDTKTSFSSWKQETYDKVKLWVSDNKTAFSDWKTDTYNKVSGWSSDVKKAISDWWTKTKEKFDEFKSVSFDNWATNTYRTLSNWASNVWESFKDKIGKAIDKVKELLRLDAESSEVTINSSGGGTMSGHATGGIFNREHIARFAEGNKAEAVIPLENASAMQPFVDAISRGIIEGIAPVLVQTGQSQASSMPPLYVGTLIGDERSLKQLYKRFEVFQAQDDARKGLTEV